MKHQALFSLKDKSKKNKSAVCCSFLLGSLRVRSGGGVVDIKLDYQSRNSKIDLPLLQSFG